MDEASLAYWRTWIGHRNVRQEVLCVEALRRYAAAVGSDLDVERIAPPIGHWAFFLQVAPTAELGMDGHPEKGGFLPPIPLPRRMFAAAEIEQSHALRTGKTATLTDEIVDVAQKAGRSGPLVFVTVERRIAQNRLCVLERQTIVYRGAGGVEPLPSVAPDARSDWTPTRVDLFRFSAATFNSHRIHYDGAYAVDVEGHPDLVVHGPMTAARLFRFAEERLKKRPSRFHFRATAPLFVEQPVSLQGGQAEGVVQAVRCDGVTAVTAQAA